METLIDSIPGFANVFFFLVFFVLFFGILGIQLFSGIFEQRCRLTPYPINNVWLIDDTNTGLCQKGLQNSCQTGLNFYCFSKLITFRTFCGAPVDYNIPFNETELNTPDLFYGYLNFDSIFHSSLVIFVCLVVDGWTKITYVVVIFIEQMSLNF